MPDNQQQFSSRNDSESPAGALYVVATPIGNLGDITVRASEVLESVDLILAEDTRQTAKLLMHLGVGTNCLSYHQHNETELLDKYLGRIKAGDNIALVSDAGTPLISDPGFPLVRAAREQQINVIPVPGACALIAALSVAGLPVSQFCFEGFLPAKKVARAQALELLVDESRTLVFYESTHRITACIDDMALAFGADRVAVIARELTKTFEQVQQGSLAELGSWLAESDDHLKGEFVVIVEGSKKDSADDQEMTRLISLLLPHMGVKQAAKIATEFSGSARNQMYELALALKSKMDG